MSDLNSVADFTSYIVISRFDCVIVKLSDCLRKGNSCHGSPTFRLALIETGVLILFPAWVTRVGIDIFL